MTGNKELGRRQGVICHQDLVRNLKQTLLIELSHAKMVRKGAIQIARRFLSNERCLVEKR